MSYYEENADNYKELWNDEFKKNYSFNIPETFLKYLEQNSYILDLGCGTGRDSLYFKEMGFKVECVDASKKMCKIASSLLNQKVHEINFLNIDYDNLFDGVYACASLLHLNNDDLLLCLKKINKALKQNGIFYSSFKLGTETRISNNRYFNDMTEEKFQNICNQIREFHIIKHWITNKYQSNEKFINFLIKKK